MSTEEKAITTGHEPQGVAHPRHYNTHESGIETIEVCEGLTFNLGNACKYIMRAGQKGSRVEDLRKAAFYLDRAHERQVNAGKNERFSETVVGAAFNDGAAFVAWGAKIDRVLNAEVAAGRPQSPLAVLTRGLVRLFARQTFPRKLLEEVIGAVADEIDAIERQGKG